MNTTDLINLLNRARAAYYGHGQPIMSDAEFDGLEAMLASRPKSPEITAYFAKIGNKSPTNTKWVKVAHTVPMGSLNKAQNLAELQDWDRGAGNKPDSLICWSEKLDGMSILLTYQNGQLVSAVTRGDGTEGEDITRNVRLMGGLPKQAKDFTGHIRGEIILTKSNWKAHLPHLSNPRNGANGTAKTLDGVGTEYLTVVCYKVHKPGGKPIVRKAHEFQILAHLGFKTPNWGRVVGLQGAEDAYQEYVKSKRDALDYDIDGLVVEVDNLTREATLGGLNGRPRGAIAYKFPHAEAVTILQDIVWQVGQSGRITPVAIFDTVDLAGAQVSRASLANVSLLEGLIADAGGGDLRKGATILVSRRNDVIPKTEKILNIPVVGEVLSVPTTCPECGTKLVEDGKFLLCPNVTSCPAQVAGMVSRWLEKTGRKGWGDEIVTKLCESGKVRDIADLYTLKETEFADLQLSGRRLGEAVARALIVDIHSNKVQPLATYVGSLGIDMCSRSMCQIFVDAGYDTLDKLYAAQVSDLAAIDKVGQTKAESFVEGLARLKPLIAKMQLVGVCPKATQDGPLRGHSFCVTGFRDAALDAALEASGATLKTSVSRGLTFLVAKDPNGASGKLDTARKYGTVVIGVQDAYDLSSGKKTPANFGV